MFFKAFKLKSAEFDMNWNNSSGSLTALASTDTIFISLSNFTFIKSLLASKICEAVSLSRILRSASICAKCKVLSDLNFTGCLMISRYFSKKGLACPVKPFFCIIHDILYSWEEKILVFKKLGSSLLRYLTTSFRETRELSSEAALTRLNISMLPGASSFEIRKSKDFKSTSSRPMKALMSCSENLSRLASKASWTCKGHNS
mmetsp:Transcript_5584/g.8320  ORF Transcript_5584/g.8320 Transcript_5584/m.8320 type:complete len:202 (-) Transcript_5584:1516-2121(-)